MPRTARIAPGGIIYHVLNRGNGRRKLFHKESDYGAFLELLAESVARVPMRILGFCLMPNHWHLILWPHRDGDLSNFMRWLSNTHVRRYHQHYHSYGEGHVYQGRFKSFPVQSDEHLLTVLRYVEANPLRARMVSRAADWKWTSLVCRRSPRGKVSLLSQWPVDRPRAWNALINEPMRSDQLEQVRSSAKRGRPLGNADWSKKIASRLHLQAKLNPRGRPKKPKQS